MLPPVARKLAVAAFLACGVAFFLLVRESDVGPGLILWDPTESPEGPVPPEAGDAGAAGPSDESRTEEPLATHGSARTIAGRVVRFDGSPVGGVAVRQEHPYLSAGPVASGADGSFQLPLEEARGELVIDAPAWMLLGGERRLSEQRSDGYLLVLAEPAQVRGRVVDDTGAAVADALVRVSAPGDALVRFGLATTPLEHPAGRGYTDAQGRFALGPVPFVPGTRVEGSHHGFRPAVATLAAPGEVELVLQRLP